MTILITPTWEPRDLWMGVFVHQWYPLIFYICPLPTIAIRVEIEP